MIYLSRVLVACLVVLVSACNLDSADVSKISKSGPVTVELKLEDGRYQLYHAGEPYRIRGAGLEFGSIEALARHGGNSFRTWRTDNGEAAGLEVLDAAYTNGLTVTMGLELTPERKGFDYSDSVAVRAQFEDIKQQVLELKDHPALLMWSIGNEMNLFATNPEVWDAVNDISLMIHEVDPHHLTTTALAGISSDLIEQISERAPDIDLISIQMYGDIVNLPRYIKEMNWTGPYIVSEWGATGHWEVPVTPWDAPIENTSSEKADAYLSRYESAIDSDQTQSLGSYVFLWGQKTERTPTWYGIFLESGEETESVDVMQKIWNGEWPDNRSPRLTTVELNGKSAHDGILLEPGQSYGASVLAEDPDSDLLSYFWDVKPETEDLSVGGDIETTPESIPGLILNPDSRQIELVAPVNPGAYRLFAYVYDQKGHAAHANIPFFVTK